MQDLSKHIGSTARIVGSEFVGTIVYNRMRKRLVLAVPTGEITLGWYNTVDGFCSTTNSKIEVL